MRSQAPLASTARSRQQTNCFKGTKRVFVPDSPKNDHHEPSKKKGNHSIEEGKEKSLTRWKSNPNLLMTNSYIKLADVESGTLQSLIQNLSNQPETRPKLNSVKSEETFQPLKRSNKSRDKKEAKFKRKISHDHDPIPVRQEELEKTLLLQTKELEILQNELDLLTQTLDSKNRKLREYERLVSILKKQNQEKLWALQKEVGSLSRELEQKEKENCELQSIIKQSNKQNESLSKRVEELMITEPSIFQDGHISFSFGEQSDFMFEMASTAEHLGSLNELEDELQQKTLEIYELRKSIDKMTIREHCLEAKHQEELRRVAQEASKKHKELAQKYRKLESELREWKAREVERRLELNYSESEVNLSLRSES